MSMRLSLPKYFSCGESSNAEDGLRSANTNDSVLTCTSGLLELCLWRLQLDGNALGRHAERTLLAYSLLPDSIPTADDD
ncbi:hypothetical protein SERLA73DRAFT_132226, partial [Serpula lacrymans var. lacrymans S7.3]